MAKTSNNNVVNTKNSKNTTKKNLKANKPTIGKKLNETRSELKKVTWPSFSKVVKQTGVVIGMVLIFTVVLFGIDQLLGFLFNLLVK